MYVQILILMFLQFHQPNEFILHILFYFILLKCSGKLKKSICQNSQIGKAVNANTKSLRNYVQTTKNQ